MKHLVNQVPQPVDGQHRLTAIGRKSFKNYSHTPSETYTVYFTKNYEMFEFLEDNRELNERNKKKLMRSIAKYAKLFSAIIVNEKGEIIDGQHRLKSRMELEKNLPIDQRTGIHYIICKGYGIKEVQILNDAVKRWDGDDYLHSFCQQGESEYLKFKSFKDKYNTDYWITLRMLTGNLNKKSKGDMNDSFRTGNLVIKQEEYDKSCDLMDKIEEIKNNNWFIGDIDRAFILAFHKVYNIPGFDYKVFVEKLAKTRSQITQQPKFDLYVKQFGKIYNQGLSKKKQISLPIKTTKKVVSMTLKATKTKKSVS